MQFQELFMFKKNKLALFYVCLSLSAIASTDCRDFKIRWIEGGEMLQPIGSLSFNLCHSIEGIPQLYEAKLGNEWKNFERCFWKKTKTFVDLSDLVEFYNSRSVR